MVSIPLSRVAKAYAPDIERQAAVLLGLPEAFEGRTTADPVPDMPPLPDAVVAQRLMAKMLQTSPQQTEWHCIKLDHAAMAAADQWDDLLEALRFADQSRASASGGKRLATLISKGARTALGTAIARRDWAAADVALARIDQVYAAHSEDYTAAHLAAQAQLDVAWGKRGIAELGRIPGDLWAESTAHVARAERILDLFDPIVEMSPLLAGTRYLLVRGIEDGASQCRDWYEDWCDLDPEDADIHATHAQHLLPHWFGTLADFDREATRAARLTNAQTGQAAYAISYISAAETLGDLPPGMDLERFLAGLTDFQTATGCQYRANVAANALGGLAQMFRAGGRANDRAGDTETAYALGLVRAALSDLVCNRLTEVHLSTWEDGLTGVTFAMNEVFGRALHGGARIVVRGSGLAAQMPAA